eukprot:TRINITY_DN3642_c0_g3_i3.p1 TRINITY_DN3642_c0_g3~~TRINITY_DN3642_c0_g3_i3.p1  ORF type:complete len:148 (+),score=17.02 TRINITY_DN3642_c0_g3_i3:68-511(+)
MKAQNTTNVLNRNEVKIPYGTFTSTERPLHFTLGVCGTKHVGKKELINMYINNIFVPELESSDSCSDEDLQHEALCCVDVTIGHSAGTNHGREDKAGYTVCSLNMNKIRSVEDECKIQQSEGFVICFSETDRSVSYTHLTLPTTPYV